MIKFSIALNLFSQETIKTITNSNAVHVIADIRVRRTNLGNRPR